MLRPVVLLSLLAGPLARPAGGRPRPRHHRRTTTSPSPPITELAVSPDGKHVAYCEGRWDKADDDRKTDLWVVATDGKGKPRRLTGDRANDRHPKWSADGKTRLRPRQPQARGREEAALRRHDAGLAGRRSTAATRSRSRGSRAASPATTTPRRPTPSSTPSTPRPPTRTTSPSCASKFDKLEYGHGKRKVSEVHRLDLATWRAEKVIDEKRYVREFAVTPDGKRVAMIVGADDTVDQVRGRVAGGRVGRGAGKVDAADEAWRKTAASPCAVAGRRWRGPRTATRLAFCADLRRLPGRDHRRRAEGRRRGRRRG